MSRIERSLGRSSCLKHFVGRLGAVATGGLEFRIGVAPGPDDVPNVLGQLWVEILPAAAAPRRKVLHTAETGLVFVNALGDVLASPAKTPLGVAGIAVAEPQADLGLEKPALMAGQSFRPNPQ